MNMSLVNCIINLVLIAMLALDSFFAIRGIIKEKQNPVHCIQLHLKKMTLVIKFKMKNGKCDILGCYVEKKID